MLFIATPCYGNQMYTPCAESLLKLSKKIDFEWKTIGFDSLVPRARNYLVSMFLKSKCDTLLFLDSDIVFSPDDVQKLINSDKDIICGMYPKKSIDKEIVKKRILEGVDDPLAGSSHLAINLMNNNSKIQNNLIELLDAPTGFMMIKKTVFENLIKSNEVPYYYSDIKGYSTQDKIYNFFDISIENKRLLSEDYHFCRILQNQNYTIYAHTKVILKHIGNYTYT